MYEPKYLIIGIFMKFGQTIHDAKLELAQLFLFRLEKNFEFQICTKFSSSDLIYFKSNKFE